MTGRLIAIAIRLNLKRLRAFRASLVLEVGASLSYAAITAIFWNVIYRRVQPLPGWSLGQTFAFTALIELFYAVTMSVFVATGKFWGAIISGRIDIYLIRPTEPRLLMGLLAIRLENLIRAIPSVTLLAALAGVYGFRPTVTSVLAALIVTALGTCAYACLQMAGSWASFWLGRTQVLDEITDSFTEFTQYPHTVFPPWVRLALLTVVPMGLAATEPALLLSGMSIRPMLVIGGAVAVTLAWWVMQELLWKRGLRRYDSYGG